MKLKILALLLIGGLVAVTARIDFPGSGQPALASKQPQQTLDKALEYLAKHQAADGHWEGDDGKHPVAMTALVGLALFMERADEIEIERSDLTMSVRKHANNVHAAAAWLKTQSRADPNGLIFSDHPSESSRYMEGHGLATLFLAGVHPQSPQGKRDDWFELIVRAAWYIRKARSTQGGWYHTSTAEGHDLDAILPTVIQIQALHAVNAGWSFSDVAINEGKAYLNTAIGKPSAAGANEQTKRRPIDIASAFVCHNNDFLLPIDADGEKWFEECSRTVPVGPDMRFGRDELTHFYYAQAAFRHGGDAWKNYRTATFERLAASQNHDGSWPSSEGISVGRVYSTALWCIVLQLENERYPAIKRTAW